ncbi:MAG: DNA repair exonuclease, partial [Promethearchaeota archaeon]
MTYKFAHISDTHIGAFGTRKKLADLVLKAFDQAIDICIQEEVNFVIFSGDLFDTNLPDLDIVVKAIHSLNKLRENNIPIYTIAGGHDTSSSHRSILDILIATGLLIRVTTGKYDDNKNLVLEFTIDSKTNAKITGISGRSQSLDKSYYEKLNRKILEDEKGFKIFTFHCFIDVLTPSDYAKVESVPLTWFPKNFQYYAGGHLHKTIHEPSGTFNGYGHFCYPGPLFAASTKDLEENAKKTIRGFFIIDFDEDVKNIKFVKIKPCSYELVKFKADDKTSTKFMDEIVTHVQKIDAPNKIVLLKCTGMLSAGKTSDIDFVKIR